MNHTILQNITEKKKRKSKIEYCEITLANGKKQELTHPEENAGHILATYNLTFNKQFDSDMNELLNFMGNGIDKLGKIKNSRKDKLEHDVRISEMMQSLKALRLGAGGGPDRLSAILLSHMSKAVPNLVLGAMQGVTIYESKLH